MLVNTTRCILAPTSCQCYGTADGLYGVRYTDFVMPLVKSVQELSTANETLKKQNEELPAQMSDLKTVVLDMQKSLSQCCSNYQPAQSNTLSNDSKATLEQNVPNPVTSNTVIRCTVLGSFQVAVVKVYNTMGAEVMSFPVAQSGTQSFTVNGSSLAAGIYQYSLMVDGQLIDTKKMVLTK